ncbi:6-bladed beta-propeller [Rhodohalobacter sulfatireducens]|uniref:6-bladed beta-propeller n=1 Tax=Rhodohalobacter sulfatireducens TaxID=2911366 RepID=A0ABS9KBM4_9BACT|nr:6-bladed beta-propeller [Rhodohalobacter sulfatireducens]MCG2588230.1 6-bladed beta-propeller [Rhodohalobacter sulfatireducens]
MNLQSPKIFWRSVLFSLLILLLLINCSSQEDEIPEKLRDLKNLTVYSANAKPEAIVSFQKVANYGTFEEILIGRIQDIGVDSSGRVFVVDMQKQSIYVFGADGAFITQLGREGKGPDEFSTIRSLQICKNRLYVYEPDQYQISVFTLDNLANKSSIFLAENRGDYQALGRSLPWINNLYVRNNATYLAGFIIHPDTQEFKPWQNVDYKILFYLLDETGRISSTKLFDVDQTHTVAGGLVDNIKVFFGSPMITMSSQNNIYVSDESEFFVKVYNPNGVYMRAFHYQHPQIPLTQESIKNGGIANTHFRPDFLLKNIKSIDLPQYWPVITDMKIDDLDRLWIATTAEDMSIYEWWVLEETGELITKFEWPRDEPIEVVLNGNIYTRKTDDETGLQQIVKYRFEINE